MKLRLLILLAAAALAGPAAGQTIKSLGYNTTNGQVVYSGSNSLTFTNALQFSTNARATTRTNLGLGGSDSVTFSNLSLSANGSLAIGGMNVTAITSGIDLAFKRAGSTELELKTNGLILHTGSYDFSGGNSNGASTTRTNLGLGGTNTVTFSNIQLNSFPSGSSTGFVGRNGAQLSLYGTNVSTSVPAFYGYDGFNNTAFSAATARTNLELGATNNVTFSNVTASGTLTATGNATLNGVNNTMPGATNAASASSLMTRDLVGQEFANPRDKIQTTYWFTLEGQGAWTTAGTAASTSYSASGNTTGFYGGINISTTTRIGLNVNGAALRLNSSADGGGNYTVSTSGALTLRARLRKHGAANSENAAAFIMGFRNGTSIWQEGAYGLYSVSQPTNVWTSNAVVAQHDRISVSNVVWAVNTAGTNGATEPAWTDLIGSLVTNGSAVYVNAGPHTSNNWVLAIGHTNASQVVMTNTGKQGFVTGVRSQVVLKLRTLGTTNSPYPIFATVENSAGESTEVSLTTTNASSRQPQFWSRFDALNTGGPDPAIIYFSVDGQLGSL